MALARVVGFSGVTNERIEELREQIGEHGRPDEIPASEMLLLYDAEGQRSLAILIFENEDDYQRGDAALQAMPTDETPGSRTSIDKYTVAIRATP
jgi:hypothetical protein